MCVFICVPVHVCVFLPFIWKDSGWDLITQKYKWPRTWPVFKYSQIFELLYGELFELCPRNQQIQTFEHCFNDKVHKLPNNVLLLQCCPCRNVCSHIVAFHSNTVGIVHVAFCVFFLPWTASIRCTQLNGWTHLHPLQCSIRSITEQLGKHAKSRNSMLFTQTSVLIIINRVKKLPWFITFPICI